MMKKAGLNLVGNLIDVVSLIVLNSPQFEVRGMSIPETLLTGPYLATIFLYLGKWQYLPCESLLSKSKCRMTLYWLLYLEWSLFCWAKLKTGKAVFPKCLVSGVLFC